MATLSGYIGAGSGSLSLGIRSNDDGTWSGVFSGGLGGSKTKKGDRFIFPEFRLNKCVTLFMTPLFDEDMLCQGVAG